MLVGTTVIRGRGYEIHHVDEKDLLIGEFISKVSKKLKRQLTTEELERVSNDFIMNRSIDFAVNHLIYGDAVYEDLH